MLQYRIPVRPYKNFNEYLKCISAACRHKRQYPCFDCGGYGFRQDPAERDDYEGHKLTPYSKCPRCNATGEITRAQYKDFYDEEIANWRTDVTRNKIKNRAIKKLTPTERKVLGLV